MTGHFDPGELRDPHGKWSRGGAVIKRMAKEAAASSSSRHSPGTRVIWKDKKGREHPATVDRAYTVPRSPEPQQYSIKLDKPVGRYQETRREVPHSQLRKAG